MTTHAVVVPFLGTMLLTLVAWVWLYIARFRWLYSAGINPQQLALGAQSKLRPTTAVISSTAHFGNLFELPTIFYGLCLFSVIVGFDDSAIGIAAWIFFVARIAHTLIHLSINRVAWRFAAYAVSAVALWTILLRITWLVLVAS